MLTQTLTLTQTLIQTLTQTEEKHYRYFASRGKPLKLVKSKYSKVLQTVLPAYQQNYNFLSSKR